MARAVGDLFGQVFTALEASGTPWLVLRGVGPFAGPADDVDVLVGTTSRRSIDALLAGTSFVRVPPRGAGSHRFPVRVREHEFRAYDEYVDGWADLDVLTEVAFGPDLEFRTRLAAELLARRRRVDGVFRLHPADEFWYLVAHDLLKRGDLAPYRREPLAARADEAGLDGPVQRLVESLAPGSVARLRQAVVDDDRTALTSLGATLRRSWETSYSLGVQSVRVVGRVVQRLPSLRERGISVALMGPDGAGKTTLAESLRRTVPMPSGYVYLGIWRDSRFEPVLQHVLGARLAVRMVTLIGKSGWIVVQRRLGRLVVLDRYTADADLPYDRHDWKGRVSAVLVRRTVPEPDLVVVLDAPGQLMFDRKGEHTVAELQASRDNYLRMVGSFRHAAVIDATQPPEVVRRRATTLVWRRWSGRDLSEPVHGMPPQGNISVLREGVREH